MIPTKTFLELQIAYREIFDKEPITDADKLGRIASLNLFNNSRWVSVDVLRQKLHEKLTDIKNSSNLCQKMIDDVKKHVSQIDLNKKNSGISLHTLGQQLETWILLLSINQQQENDGKEFLVELEPEEAKKP